MWGRELKAGLVPYEISGIDRKEVWRLFDKKSEGSFDYSMSKAEIGEKTSGNDRLLATQCTRL